ISGNARVILRACRERGIEPYAVIKGYNALPEINATLVESGFGCLASSRLHHLRRVKADHPGTRTLALRIPMRSEVADLVRWADCSLCSEIGTIEAIDAEAGKQGRPHGVILMRDLGDLREGVWGAERFVETAIAVEKKFRRVRLYGIGANLSCYGTVKPGTANMADLANCAAEIERGIGRRLDVVSGGASTSLPMLVRGEMPRAVNNLRIGAGLMHRGDIYGVRDGELTDVTDDTMFLEGEIVEIGEKPTHPVGELDVDCFGNTRVFEDRGIRRRAILAFGAFDVGDVTKLTPLDPDTHILGSSSDHTIVDIHDSGERYRLGGTMRFRMEYQSMLYATANESVEKIF
ncbi:alanine racemase, partial [Synergistaceae bacterium OttesenSCG-928-I11]|nr:alanine racemase [Synergistaceae bacterium OttesenSCG-928-I11]